MCIVSKSLKIPKHDFQTYVSSKFEIETHLVKIQLKVRTCWFRLEVMRPVFEASSLVARGTEWVRVRDPDPGMGGE